MTPKGRFGASLNHSVDLAPQFTSQPLHPMFPALPSGGYNSARFANV